MPRSHARVSTAIWADKDFQSLTMNAQLTYLMLLSQPELGHSGLLPMTIRRWAGQAADSTPESVRAGIDELADANFVIVDDDTEELLIRSMVRNDGVWKQPKVLSVALAEAARIRSARLRDRFVAELGRIDVLSLPVKTVGEVRALLEDLPRPLAQAHEEARMQAPTDPPPHPPAKGPAHPSAEGDADPPRGQGKGNGEYLQGSPVPGDHGQALPAAPASQAAIPPPAGADAHEGQAVLVVVETKPPKRQRTRKADRTPLDDQADELTSGYWDRFASTQAMTWIAVRQIVLSALTNGADRNQLAWALVLCGEQGKPITAPILSIALTVIKNAQKGEPAGSGAAHAAPVDFRQQATNDMFARALERARQKDAQEAS